MRVLTRPDRNGPPVWRPIINHTVFKAEDQVKKEKKKKNWRTVGGLQNTDKEETR